MFCRLGAAIGLVAVVFQSAHAEQMPGGGNADRAQVNYMLNCQGCHGADGAGTEDGVVPEMKNFVGHFLSTQAGREFLVRVPGSANAALSNDELAEVLNWMLYKISAEQIPSDFQPFEASEVGSLRSQPLADVDRIRARLIEEFERD